jgi:hypothetical protein
MHSQNFAIGDWRAQRLPHLPGWQRGLADVFWTSVLMSAGPSAYLKAVLLGLVFLRQFYCSIAPGWFPVSFESISTKGHLCIVLQF